MALLAYLGGPFDVHTEHVAHEPHVPVSVTMALLAYLGGPFDVNTEHEPHVPVSVTMALLAYLGGPFDVHAEHVALESHVPGSQWGFLLLR